jgi:hypothetical protein
MTDAERLGEYLHARRLMYAGYDTPDFWALVEACNHARHNLNPEQLRRIQQLEESPQTPPPDTLSL